MAHASSYRPWITGDQREKRNGWAPGDYSNKCNTCGSRFTGDKRAWTCADCAYKEEDYTAALAYMKTWLVEGLEKAWGIPDSWCVDYTYKSEEEKTSVQKEIDAYNARAAESNRQLKIRKACEDLASEYPVTMQCIKNWCEKMKEELK